VQQIACRDDLKSRSKRRLAFDLLSISIDGQVQIDGCDRGPADCLSDHVNTDPFPVYWSRCARRGAGMSTNRHALVVDDDSGIRVLVCRILARQGFTVDTARDGAEAIEKLLGHDYDLITLDLMMPRIDGMGVVKYMVEHRPEYLGRVLVMTAFGASALSKVCPPVARFIEKPFNVDTLIAQATECLDSGGAEEDAAAAENP
jgi:CheY-like chemotaxis protein